MKQNQQTTKEHENFFKWHRVKNCVSILGDSGEPVETWIEHDSMNYITVDGFQAPMYYQRVINYDTDIAGLTEVIERSVSCEQAISYKCNNSRIMLQAEIDSKLLIVFVFCYYQ